MSRRLSLQLKNNDANSKPKPRVKFSDELVFLESIKDKDIDSVRNMLRRASANIDINKINDSGLTALHQAVLENSLDLITLLIEAKANVNSLDEESWTPLHGAAAMGYYEVAKYLLENGADAGVLTADKERPIDLVDQDDFPLISLLLNHMNLSSLDIEDPQSSTDVKSNSKSSSSSSSSSSNISYQNSDSLNANSCEYYHKKFLNAIKGKSDNEAIINEIEKLVNKDKVFMQTNKFVRSLTMALCESAMIKNDVNKNELRLKLYILMKYIDSNELECECLSAIYELAEKHNHPSDLFKKCITCLNETKIIKNSIYQMWRSKETGLDKKKVSFNLKN